MKKSVLRDTWFQMFAAVGGIALVVSALGTVSTRHAAPAAADAAPPAVRAPASAGPATAGPAAAPAYAEGPITPAPPSSSDLATYGGSAPSSVGQLVVPPPPPPPKMTLTGTGVGNAQGLVGGSGGGLGSLNSLLSSMLSAPSLTAPLSAQRALPALPPPTRIVPSRAGIIMVAPVAGPGVDTTSLRDAVFSASNEDLILLKPGTYEGPVAVHDKSVRLRGTGATPASVVVRWTGPGATISVRNGKLELQKLRVERGSYPEHQKSEPGGAVYAIASTLALTKVELDSSDFSAPPLIVEQGSRPTSVSAEDSRVSTIGAGVLIRGAVKAALTRVTFHATSRPLSAWIDAVVTMRDCVFLDAGAPSLIHAYEGARVTVVGKNKPWVTTVRDSEVTGFEDSFGGARPQAAQGFARDIFRQGRKAGALP